MSITHYEGFLGRKFQLLIKSLDQTCDFKLNDRRTPKEVFESIQCAHKVVSQIRRDDANSSSLRLQNIAYIVDIWHGEFPPESNMDTAEIVESLFDGNTSEALAQLKDSGLLDPQRTFQKISNVLAASRYLFGANLALPMNDPLSVNVIQEIHRKLGANELFARAGEYREREVSAVNSSVRYLPPGKISKRLQILIDFINKATERNDVHRMCTLGALLFSEFLLIHPFSNGNGRCARLLMNYFLKDSIFVPFSLMLKNRQLYLDVLDERNNQDKPPTVLLYYLLLCIDKCYQDIIYLELQ